MNIQYKSAAAIGLITLVMGCAGKMPTGTYGTDKVAYSAAGAAVVIRANGQGTECRGGGGTNTNKAAGGDGPVLYMTRDSLEKTCRTGSDRNEIRISQPADETRRPLRRETPSTTPDTERDGPVNDTRPEPKKPGKDPKPEQPAKEQPKKDAPKKEQPKKEKPKKEQPKKEQPKKKAPKKEQPEKAKKPEKKVKDRHQPKKKKNKGGRKKSARKGSNKAC